MRIKKNLLKPAVLLSAVCLFLAVVGTAEAAELLGIHGSEENKTSGADSTSTIMLIDTALGTAIEVADTGLSRVDEGTDSSAVNGLPGPNGLAFDTDSGKAYFASFPNSGGGSPMLYSVVVDPPGGTPVIVGTPSGARLFDAAFFDGKYWYIDAGTDDLRSISFDPTTGMLASDVLEAELLTGGFAGHTFGFGDIAIQDGTLYGAGRRNPGAPGGPIVFFSVDLSSLPNYTEHQTDDPATLPLQLAFGGEGTLFGQTGALTDPPEQDLYYVSLVPGTLGERGKVLTDFAGGPYTDMSAFNPLCGSGQLCPLEAD